MKTMKKLTAIVLAMLMVMSMGVFSSFACEDTTDVNGDTVIVECVDAETPADGFCDVCEAAVAECTCDEGSTDEPTAEPDGLCDLCGEEMPEESSSDPLDFFSNIIATLQGYVEKIVEFFQDFIDTIRGFGDA